MKIRLTALLAVLSVATVGPLVAQERPPEQASTRSIAAATAEAMARLHFLLGRWEGEATTRMGPGEPQQSRVDEHAYAKLDGRVVLLEGLGTVPDADGGPPKVVHEAFGVLSYDAEKGEYLMRAIKGDGQTVDADIEVGDRRVVWGFAVPSGRIRYTLELDGEGRWHEVGEFSRDGTAWMRILEMTLRRVGEP